MEREESAKMEMKIAQIQMNVYENKEHSLSALRSKLEELLRLNEADLVCLGEMWNCPYVTSAFPIYAEPEGGEMWHEMSDIAREYSIYLSAGTMPERDGDRVYNTGYVFDRSGKEIAKHRKMHLFDINVRGKQVFAESETLSPGNEVTVFDSEFGKIGLMICFDGRFPELARLMVLQGAKIILCPAAFNMTTGPLHWEIMNRSRAIDNQCFVAASSNARCEEAGYTAWGHSMLISPWGEIISELDEKEGIALNTIDLSEVDSVREQLPLLNARRTDIYSLDLIEASKE